MNQSARATALRVLVSCRNNGAWADAALKAQISRDGLSGPDAALCSRIVYGVMQNRMLLDFYIGAYCTQKPDHLQPPLLEILRIGAYQIIYLDKIPDSAAVNTSVELAKLAKRWQASGLVNAVLRKLSQNKKALPPVPERDDVQRLSIQYSHPKWFVKRLVSLLGREEAERFLACDNQIAPITVQVNPLKTTLEALTEELQQAGISVQPHSWVPDCLELSGTGDLAALPSFREGKFLVQDPAARLVSLIAGIRPGQKVLDVCAAPGGKSLSAAFAMAGNGSIVACDLHENKLKRIQESADRLGVNIITTQAADGRVFRPEWEASFDTVLVDAPCSGLGIIRKKPDTRYKKADDLFTLPVVQAAILDNAARYVRPGGTLVYSTCTILPEENEQVTEAFLAEHADFGLEPFELPLPVGKSDGSLTLWPQRHDTDGFYICRMTRR
ncbi:16S rRNA (cytosine(967)-C(5))-methyltransferase RsmB [Oscillibacter valericigenes]|uniref:16S rRNA (cytosine(967)-C(5))-methyltransferase RsmB n=1 Tax=Oscillibacter valericigenes TaxID=351091 RepID=UPI001F1DDD3B|nr:16S rRNA (cytosine(967)-C(5))-methyltransferase RsmB [Oscillibacter valericigenes]MCF2616948.1 16S rRNA (cytosine(967)-C(5))-methyltransferase RsmB [Oscillibacter valericigenes]